MSEAAFLCFFSSLPPPPINAQPSPSDAGREAQNGGGAGASSFPAADVPGSAAEDGNRLRAAGSRPGAGRRGEQRTGAAPGGGASPPTCHRVRVRSLGSEAELPPWKSLFPPQAREGARAPAVTARKTDPQATEEEREQALETLSAPHGSEVQPRRAARASGP